MGRKGDKRLGQFVDDLVTICAAEMRQSAGVSEAAAQVVAVQIANRMCFQYARSYMYVPANMELTLTPRDEDIWRQYCEDSAIAKRYTAARIDEIAAERDLTARQVYNIIALIRRREAAALQPELPGIAEGPAA